MVLRARSQEAFATMEAVGLPVGPVPTDEALEFIRFCYRRRGIGWPELYDEMCAVAGRGLYQGWGAEELAAVGIGLSLPEMPGLAALAARVIAEETVAARRRDSAAPRRRETAAMARREAADARVRETAGSQSGARGSAGHRSRDVPTAPEHAAADAAGSMRLAPRAI
jgi:hypothetical protein